MAGEMYLLHRFSGKNNQVLAYDLLDLSDGKVGTVYKYESSRFVNEPNGNMYIQISNNLYRVTEDDSVIKAHIRSVNNLDRFVDGGNGFLKWSVSVVQRLKKCLLDTGIEPYFIYVNGYSGKFTAQIGYGFSYTMENKLDSGCLMLDICEFGGSKNIEFGIMSKSSWNKVMSIQCGITSIFTLSNTLSCAVSKLDTNYNLIPHYIKLF